MKYLEGSLNGGCQGETLVIHGFGDGRIARHSHDRASLENPDLIFFARQDDDVSANPESLADPDQLRTAKSYSVAAKHLQLDPHFFAVQATVEVRDASPSDVFDPAPMDVRNVRFDGVPKIRFFHDFLE